MKKRHSILVLAFVVAAGFPIIGALGQGVPLWTPEKPGSDNLLSRMRELTGS